MVGAPTFAHYLAAMQAAQGETLELLDAGNASEIVQSGWRLMDGVTLPEPALAFRAWNAIWEGALAAHDRERTLKCEIHEETITWRIV